MNPALAVLTAAGTGSRLGSQGPKALVRVHGVTMLERAATTLANAGVAAIVVTAPEGSIPQFRDVLPGIVPGFPHVPVHIVAGGLSRQGSVAAGLDALPILTLKAGLTLSPSTIVLVHDAARCLTPVSAITRVINAVRAGAPAVVPGLPVTDTLKEVGEEAPPAGRPVVATPERSTLRAIQTPQGFTWDVIVRAHDHGAERALTELTAATDDAGLVEAMGLPVVVVDGDPQSMKITTALDLKLAEILAE